MKQRELVLENRQYIAEPAFVMRRKCGTRNTSLYRPNSMYDNSRGVALSARRFKALVDQTTWKRTDIVTTAS